MTAFLFLLAHAAIVLFGLPAAYHPVFHRRAMIARAGACYLLGTILLTVEGLIWTLIGIQWTVWTLAIPLAAASFGAALFLSSRQESAEPGEAEDTAFKPETLLAIALTVAALAFFGMQLASARATSDDFLFFWGVKGVHFAQAQGIDVELLKWPFFHHGHVNYPPLLPTVYAWSILVAGAMPWIWAPVSSIVWVAAAAVVLAAILRSRLEPVAAATITSVWTVILCASMARSPSGGIAEPPLVAFLTIACAALLSAQPGVRSVPSSVVAIAFAGAVLTKNEGSVAVALLVFGALSRSWIERDRPNAVRVAIAGVAALGAYGLWALFLKAVSIPFLDPVRERAGAITFEHLGKIFAAAPAGLDVGTLTLSWWFLAIAAAASARRIVSFLPAVTLCLGLLAFTFVYYLHSADDPTILIGWTLARLCQPALSALVLWAGLAWLHDNHKPA